jgi:hypothetical protein
MGCTAITADEAGAGFVGRGPKDRNPPVHAAAETGADGEASRRRVRAFDPPVRGIDREIVREEFYAQTPVDGSEQQKQERRRKRFNRAIERAHEKQLVGVREIRGITYLWLQLQQPSEDEF